jgi:hypothetical protein
MEKVESEDKTEGFSDAGGLLAFFEVADSEKFPIEDQYVDTYIFFLKVRDIPFSYTFVFQPLPYSKELREDLLGLRMAGYLTEGSIKISDKGKAWVKGRQSIVSEFRDLLEAIIECIKEFRTYYGRKDFLDAVYVRIV